MVLKSFLKILFDVGYVFSPSFGFLPQLFSGQITYNPLLSLLTIFSSILKLYPAEDKLTPILQNQFFFCIVVHIYLIKAQMKNLKNITLPILDKLPYSRSVFKYFTATLATFIFFLSMLNFYGFSSVFLKMSFLLELAISLLHVKFQERKANFLFLLCIMTLGDLIKILLFIFKFSAPVEIVFTTTFQLGVNIYLISKHCFEKP